MTNIISRLFASLICLMMTCTSVTASSIFVSSMTLLSIKPSMLNHEILAEKAIHQKQEIQCMALGLYHEARGESVLGQYAVGATILNRVRSTAYPKTVCGVVFQNQHNKFRCQFSFACDGISDIAKDKNCFAKMQRLAKILITKGIVREAKFIGSNFQSTVDGFTHYHRFDVNPEWSKNLKQISTLGAHIFFKSSRVTKRYTH